MLDGRSRYFEYVQDKLSPWERRLRRYFPMMFLSLLSLGINTVEVRSVCRGWFDIPEAVRGYLCEFQLWEFNLGYFRQLCVANGLTASMTLFLTFVYYSSWALLALAAIVLALSYADRFRGRRRRRMVGRKGYLFYRVMLLHTAVDDVSHNPGSSQKREALSLVRKTNLYAGVSPLKEDWQADPAFRWFGENTLNRTTIRVLAALKSFRKKALYCLRNDHDMSRLGHAIDELATFLYVASLQDATEYRSLRPTPRAEEGARALARFADTLNRIQIRWEKRVSLARRVWDTVRVILDSRSTQLILGIALAAGVVITLGAVLFRIPAGTAFLYWVSIVFGSTLLGIALKTPDIGKLGD